jgi:hypothetical protein
MAAARSLDSLASVADIQKFFRYEDGKIFWRIKPGQRVRTGDEAGWLEKTGYVHISFRGISYTRSHIVWCIFNNRWPDRTLCIDHINRCRNDDRIENLREVTLQDNTRNKKAKGYTWDKSRNKWLAQIELGSGVCRNLGRFDTEAEASEAYNRAKLLYHRIGKTQGTSSDPNQAQENPSR